MTTMQKFIQKLKIYFRVKGTSDTKMVSSIFDLFHIPPLGTYYEFRDGSRFQLIPAHKVFNLQDGEVEVHYRDDDNLEDILGRDEMKDHAEFLREVNREVDDTLRNCAEYIFKLLE